MITSEEQAIDIAEGGRFEREYTAHKASLDPVAEKAAYMEKNVGMVKDTIKGSKDKVGAWKAVGGFAAAIGSFLIEDAGAHHIEDTPEWAAWKKEKTQQFNKVMKDVLPDAALKFGGIGHGKGSGGSLIGGFWRASEDILWVSYMSIDPNTGKRVINSPEMHKKSLDTTFGHETFHALTTANVITDKDIDVLRDGAKRIGVDTKFIEDNYPDFQQDEEIAARMFGRYFEDTDTFTAEEMEILGTAMEYQIGIIEAFFGETPELSEQTPLDVLEKIYKIYN